MFRDGLSMQSVSTIIFLYFANLAPIVAFGGLLGDATENRMASIEALVGFAFLQQICFLFYHWLFWKFCKKSWNFKCTQVSGLIAGVMFGLFSGQPLTILGLTGPDLVFESLVIACSIFLKRERKKSERPVDALALKISITHLLTTWNQEMLAHLKRPFHFSAARMMKNLLSCFTLRISWTSSSYWFQLVFHFDIENRQEQLKKHSEDIN